MKLIKLVGLVSLIIAGITLLIVIALLLPPSSSVTLETSQPTNTLALKNLQPTPTRIFSTATPTSLPLNSVTPMEHQAIYLIQLKGLPDPEQRRRFVAVLNQTLNRPVEVIYEYKTVYNGLAVKLSPQEANRVAKLDQVQRVLPQAQRFPQDRSNQGDERSTR